MARIKANLKESPNYSQTHFPSERVSRLLIGIKSAISLTESRALTFEDLEHLTGRPAGTVSSWFEGARMNQVEFIFALLERVPVGLRRSLVDAACRAEPTLQHPNLVHDPLAISRLEALLKLHSGFTIIRGNPEHARSFLLNAIGNSARALSSGQRRVVGVEFEPVPDWAPVPGVFHAPPQADVKSFFQRVWPRIKQTNIGSMVLLGQAWNRISLWHSEILQVASRCHVFVADEFTRPDELGKRVSGPYRVLSVVPARENPAWIRVTVQSS